jgi:hypothetical protein
MVASVYDPNDVAADAFDQDNMADGATNKNYTATEKTKLAGIAAGAEVNVNADWNSSSGDSQILNKPTLGTAAAEDVGAFATAAQGALADSAVQPGDIGTAASHAATDFATTAQGVPSGGTTGQVLAKASSTDNDTGWVDQTGGGGAAGAVVSFDALSDAEAATIDSGTNSIFLAGYYAAGDLGAALYKKVGSEPSHPGKFQSADGAWWEIAEDRISIFMTGAKADGSTDDKTAIQDAIDIAEDRALGGYASGGVYCPPGFSVKSSGGLTIDRPINVDFQSPIFCHDTTGVLLTGMSIEPDAGNSGFNLHFAAMVQSGGNTSVPSSVNSSGLTAIKLNAYVLSRLSVGQILGFTKYGIHCDGTGTTLTAQQDIFHCFMDLGQIVYNGTGIYMDSVDAATDCAEVCRWQIQMIYSNFTNIDIRNVASSSHTFVINSMDDCHPDGYGILNEGGWNNFYIGYSACKIVMQPSSLSCTVECGNDAATGVALFDFGTNNWMTSSGDQVSQIGSYLAGVWTAYTPTVGSGTGTITTSSATGRYKKIGKTVFVEMEIVITANGTGASFVTATLPSGLPCKASTFFGGKATTVSGKLLGASVAATGSTLAIGNYDNSYPAANGEHLVISGVYETS